MSPTSSVVGGQSTSDARPQYRMLSRLRACIGLSSHPDPLPHAVLNRTSHAMSTLHRHFVFETASGFCAIAWSDAGITRFQLPAKSAEAAERMLLRRTPSAGLGVLSPTVREAVAAATRYFEGEETDFSQLQL